VASLDSKRARLRAKRRGADVLGVKEMAERLGGGRNQVQQALATGQIPGAFKLGRRWLVSRAAFEQWLAAPPIQPRAEAEAAARAMTEAVRKAIGEAARKALEDAAATL
jgi:excisionase family DNA binding protein